MLQLIAAAYFYLGKEDINSEKFKGMKMEVYILNFYVFNVWSDNEDGYREVLVKASTKDKAEKKLLSSDIECDDYEFSEEVYYSNIII